LAEGAPLVGIPEAPVPAGGAAEWFAGAGGVRLRAALFPATGTPRGSVVISGGRTEPIEKYFEVIDELRGRGFTVLAHDWRGQGLSERLTKFPMRGHAVRYRDFVEDHAALLAAFESRLPKPWLALSHSMGGCLTLLVLAAGETRFAGAVLSSPMLGLFTNPVPRLLALPVTRIFLAFGASAASPPGRGRSPAEFPFEDNIVTHDRRRFERHRHQLAACPDLMLGGPTWGWLDFAFKAIAELHTGQAVTRIATPVVTVAAGDDRIVDIEDERHVIERIPGALLVEAPGAFHEVLQETDDTRAIFWREFDSLAATAAP